MTPTSNPSPPDRRLGAIDEFESMFKRAEHDVYRHADVPLGSVTVVTDGDRARGEETAGRIREFLPRLAETGTWHVVAGDDYANVGELLSRIESQAPDLIVTHRCLHEGAFVPRHTLGVYVDEMTQVTSVPVLLLPGTSTEPKPFDSVPARKVMVVTDHISGDDALVNHGVRFCTAGGTLWLCHVEDDVVFERYMDVVARIPEINTDVARDRIRAELLHRAEVYVDRCADALRMANVDVTVERFLDFGHEVDRYRALVEEHGIDLLVTNTKDAGQMAMHGTAYALGVELTDVALLML